MPDFSVPDPFVNKGPLPPGSPHFYERTELFTTVQNHLLAGDTGESISVVGERKSGKTSFLNYLSANLSPDHIIPVLINMELILPQTDKMFLTELALSAAEAIISITGEPLQATTAEAQPENVYNAFRQDLKTFAEKLPVKKQGWKMRLVWLIDEIEILHQFENEKSKLFNFLRPLAQSNPNFRLVVAGYDVLYTLATRPQSAPFFNAFQSERLKWLNPITSRKLIDDALDRMEATIAPALFPLILEWTGQKPFFLKWMMSKLADALNKRADDKQIQGEDFQQARYLFLHQPEIMAHCNHLWNAHSSERQRPVLSLIATAHHPLTHPEILEALKEKELLAGAQQAAQTLSDILIRLRQLGFLHKHMGSYSLTSGCLKTWIAQNKPL